MAYQGGSRTPSRRPCRSDRPDSCFRQPLERACPQQPVAGDVAILDFGDADKPYYDPERIKIPTLVVVAEWDKVTPSQGAQALFHKLPSGPNKRLVEIGEGTHFVMLEKNRMQLFQEVQFFLDRARRN
jgi:pimeloyl-ACP methyl ester carboxylesterase